MIYQKKVLEKYLKSTWNFKYFSNVLGPSPSTFEKYLVQVQVLLAFLKKYLVQVQVLEKSNYKSKYFSPSTFPTQLWQIDS